PPLRQRAVRRRSPAPTYPPPADAVRCAGRGGGSAADGPAGGGGGSGGGLEGGGGAGLGAGPPSPVNVVTVIVNKDENGYGMKVSGDNPVYVQSVKGGGAAEKAGLHSGDKIIKVNGVNVTQSTHTDVVALIKSATQVVLTVQQRPRPASAMALASPGGGAGEFGRTICPFTMEQRKYHFVSTPTTTNIILIVIVLKITYMELD
ncbi:Regulator of G-protein signaling loco, partial [Gryllus bimaculatus]